MQASNAVRGLQILLSYDEDLEFYPLSDGSGYVCGGGEVPENMSPEEVEELGDLGFVYDEYGPPNKKFPAQWLFSGD